MKTHPIIEALHVLKKFLPDNLASDATEALVEAGIFGRNMTQRRVDELLDANNRLLARARNAEAGILGAGIQRVPFGGHCIIDHDGFQGEVIGYYVTREGKAGVVLQQFGTKVVHVYGEKWILPSTETAPAE